MRVLSVSVALPSAEDPNTMAPLARQLDSLRNLGVQVQSIQVGGRSRFKYPAKLPTLYRALADADVVHAHYGYCGWLSRCQIRRPLVVSFMGSDLLGIPRPDGTISRSSAVVVQLDRWFARTADAVIVKSPEMADIIRPVKGRVVPNGVELGAFRPIPTAEARAILGWDDRRRVLFAGNPGNPRKGYPLATDSILALRKRGFADVELVPLHGVAADAVPLYMNACDAMIMASYLEGSPNVVKEAMACNLPVVSVPVGDVDMLFDGVDDYVALPRDPDRLAAGLGTALGRPKPTSGREAILAKGLDLDSVAKQLLMIYEEVVR